MALMSLLLVINSFIDPRSDKVIDTKRETQDFDPHNKDHIYRGKHEISHREKRASTPHPASGHGSVN
jgi:hypothetical protein